MVFQAYIFHWHLIGARIFMLSNVSQARIYRLLFMLSDDCLCDNIWHANRTIFTHYFRNRVVGLFQWHPITFVLNESDCNTSGNWRPTHWLQQSLQTSRVYITTECILCGIHTMLFCSRLFILWFVLGDAAFGFFGTWRFHDVHNVLLSGQLLRCNAQIIVTFGQMDSGWAAIVFTASGCMVQISCVAAGPICQTFGRAVQIAWCCHNCNTNKRCSYTILCKHILLNSIWIWRWASTVVLIRLFCLCLSDVLPKSIKHLFHFSHNSISYCHTTSHHTVHGRWMDEYFIAELSGFSQLSHAI